MMRRVLPALGGVLLSCGLQAQVAVCGTPGIDGPVNVASTINTYYPASGTIFLPATSTSLALGAVPPTDASGNSFGTVPISAGDLILIYQVQAADIDITNSNLYGSGTAISGPDGVGGTGYTNINNTGRYEFLVATNDVPLTGGTLTFRGGGGGSGCVYSYANRDGTAVLTQKRFQVVRVPQFSNLTLTSDLVCPPWNGYAGGIVAFDVAGDFAFGGRTISANGRGFRAGYQEIAGSGANVQNLYVTTTYDQASGKGENIAGTPRYMWDGFNAVDNGALWNGFPGGDYGKGAPGNGGGGGNDHNAGGGGGSNGGAGGEGGIGWEGGGGTWPNGGRPGVLLPQELGRLFLGGGGGGGDANNALTGVKGGVGGGLVIINAGRISGTGTITADGDNGDVGAFGSAPDGAGGGGAGGTIFLNITQSSPSANLTLSAKGGNGGNTLNDPGFEHGPGGGGGGGSIWYNTLGATVATNVINGVAGRANGGVGIVHGAVDGAVGTASPFVFTSLPPYLQGQSSTCYPELSVTKTSFSAQNGTGVPQGTNTAYTLTVSNGGSAGNAGGIRVEDFLPSGLAFVSATVAYAGGAAGPGTLTNLGTAAQPVFGDFNVPSGGTVTITVTVMVSASQSPGTYHNGAQVSWLDPTRTLANPSRRISPATDSYAGANTTYEVGAGIVPGSNYSNAPAGPITENVLVLTYPVAGDDAFPMNEDAILTAQDLKANDSDADDAVANITWSLLAGGTAAANGTLTVNANGTFNYTHTTNYNGTVSFTYQACDNDGLCDPATVTITINPVNDAPVGNDDGYTTSEDAAIAGQSVTGNDSDVDHANAQLTWSLAGGGTAAANGTLVFNANGTFNWTPNANFNGSVSFTYGVCDPAPLCDNSTTVTITVTAVNDGPIANDDGFSVNEDASLVAQSVTGNDSDGDNTNAQLVWSLVNGGTAAANGTLVFNANGTFNYTPNANFNGSVSFTCQVCDPGPLCDNATVTITVNAVNDTPVANDDNFTTNEDVALTSTVAGNDSDVDNTNAQLIWSLVSGGTAAANGTLNFTATGGFTYTPTLDFTGTVSFTYQVCDPSSACVPATVTITIGSTNDAPVANDDAFSTSEDVALIAQSITGNDNDPDGDALTYALVGGGTAAANGTLVFNANGTFNWTPAANFNGTVTFTYQACDPSAVCDAAIVTINAGATNDTPIASDDSFSTSEDVALTAQNVTGNDSDVDNTNAQLTWGLVSGGTATTNGTLVLNANGTFTWTPNTDFTGNVFFTYQVCDPSSACDPATVTITVNALNDPPVANDDAFSMNEDASLVAQSVTGNDSDPDNANAQLTWSLVSGATATANGTLAFNANGTFNYSATADFNGVVSFTYQVCDPSSACDPATVTITVNAVNDAPVANDDNYSVNEDATLTAQNVTGNDSDIDNTNAQLTWSLVNGGTAAANGTLVFNANGIFNYTPGPNYNGSVSFTYQVCDPGNSCDNAIVTITVNALNDGPTANDDGFSMSEDGTLSATSTTGNDSDPDNTNAQLTWSLVNGGTATANGALSFNADGTFSYAPNADFNGAVAFIYQVCDPGNTCDPATVTITVSAVNDAPVANDDTFSVNEEGTLTAQSVTGNDSDTETANGSLAWSLVNGGTAAANGVLVLNANGTSNYTPIANFNGSVSFIYQVCDPGPLCDNATVTITVNAVNDAPVANDDGFTTAEDAAVNTTVAGNDSDADNTSGQLTWTLLSGGTAAVNGTLNFNGDGTFNWVPTSNFNGTVTFTYTLCDPSNACDNATVTIVVGGANDAPVANDESFSTPEDNSLNATVAGNDSDTDGDVLTFTVVNGGSAAANGTLTLNANGAFSFAPNPDFTGTVSFTYQACDPANACDPATVTITVTPVNDGPIANDDAFNLNEDATLSAAVGGNDSDTETPNAGLVWTLVNGGTAGANGALTLNNDGTFNYIPALNFNGPVSFTYQVCDPGSACDPATVTITVNPLNDAPMASDDAFSMNEDGTLTAQSVTGNDSDTETPNGSLVWNLVNGGSAVVNGTLVFDPNGTFNYTPSANFNGTVSFTYQVCDPAPLCDNAVVTITVQALNDTPIANNDAFTVPEDGSIANTVAGNDTDAEGGALAMALVSGGTAAGNGTLALNADGTFTFAPDGDFNGPVSFTYEACDQNGACDQATVTITVTPVNDAPVAIDDAFTMNEDATLANTTAGNDSDIDNGNGQLAWSLVGGGTAGANGTLVLNADGTFTYAPNADFTGSVSFSYQVCDPASACDIAVATINVIGVNDTPVASDDAFSMNEDGTLTAQSVTGNDSDTDNANATLTWSLVSGGNAAANGTLVFNADGTFNYTPTANFNGPVSFTYQACDPGNACDNAIVTIAVNPVNDGPVANDDTFGVIEDGTLANGVTGNDTDIDHPNAQLTWSLVSGGSADDNGAVTFNPNGTFTYAPDAGFNGTVSFTYQVCDPGGLCDAAIVTILVGSDNDAPIAGDDTFLTNEDNAINSAVTGGDSDPDGDPLTWNLVSGGSAAVNGTLIFNSDGSFNWTPNADFNGVVTFTYEVCDPLLFCGAATVTITVLPVNDPPVANDDNFTMLEDGSLANTVSGNDSDVDSPIIWAVLDAGSAGDNGVLVFNSDGSFTWTPNTDFIGAVSFTYQACDAGPLCDDAIVTINVMPANDAPFANDDAFTMNEDASLSGAVAGNDSDADNTTGQLVWSLVNGGTAVANGTIIVTANGSFTYAPNADFNGSVSFIYQVCDPGASCDQAITTINVLPVNDAPIANDDSYAMDEGSTLTSDLGVNDSDIDGDPLTWSLGDGLSAAANGSLVVNVDGSLSYTPAPGFNGTVSFTYQVCDVDGLCDDAIVIITIGALNDVPDVNNDVTTTPEDTPVTIDVLANDSDNDGDLDDTAVTVTGQPSHGTVVVNVDGTITYTPGTDYVGVDAFQYQVCDDGTPLPAECATAFVDITVLPLNDAPTAFDDGYAILEDGGALNADVTGNDYDIDDANNVLIWSLTDGGTAAQNGTLVFNADGTFTCTPNANYYGFASFTYQTCDPGGQCEGASVFINVLPVNDPPIALGDIDNTLPDLPLTTNVSANDNDTSDLSIIDLGSITIIVPADSGTVGVNGNGTLTYTPNPGFQGNDTLIYRICDTGVPLPALCDTAILVITVTDALPLAIDDAYSLPEDSALTMDILENDVVQSGVLDPSTVVVINGPFQGTTTVNPDGTITYVPDPNYHGPDAFNYTVCTDLGFCSNASVLINIDPVNDPPIAENDSIVTEEDTPVAFSVVGNDSDLADGALGGIDSLSVTITIPPINGTGAVNVDGTINFAPGADFNGVDSLQYLVCDFGYPLPAECDTAWVVITVGEVDDPPVIIDGGGIPIDTLNVTTDEDVPLEICFNAIDPEGDTLDATNSFLGPDFGTITGEADGDTCITYIPDPDYNGGDTVTVVICDGGGFCDTVLVVIDVLPVNDPPQVVDVIGDPTDTVRTVTDEDVPVVICLDAVDIDGDSLQVTGIAGGPGNGTVNDLADGDTCFTYVPDPDFNGTDSVSVEVCDNNGGCDTVFVIIDVLPVNDDPVITDGTGSPVDTINVFTVENIPLTICVGATDLEGDTLDITSVPFGPFEGGVTGLQDGDTCFTYTPDTNYIGGDTLIAVVDDGNGGTDTVVVLITVLEANDPPVIVDGGGSPIDTINITTPEDTPLQLCLDAIDPEGLPVDITAITPIDLNGAISGISDGDTCIAYTPFPNYDGTDTLYVFVCDGFGACDSVLVIIDVTPVNDPPVITDPGFVPIDTIYTSTPTGTPLIVCLEALDVDGDTLDVTFVSVPGDGQISSLNDGDTCFTYTSDPGFIGFDTVVAVVCDPNGGCDTVVVIIDVTSPNNPPIIVDENFADADTLDFTTPEDTPIVICLTAIDFDGDTLDVTGIFGGPSNGSANGIADGDTCFTYTPVPDWNGTDTLSAIVCDDNGGCDTVLVIIQVTPVNDPPIVVDGGGTQTDTLNATTPEGIPITICPLATDIDGDALDVTAAISGPANGAITDVADGDTCFTYIPDPGFIGTDTVTVVVCDNAGACDTIVVTIDVTPLDPNEPPIAVDDATTTAIGDPVTVSILDNDSDPDGDPLTVTSAGAANGTVVINTDGTITYTPDSGFCGIDTIAYTVCDPFLACDAAIVVVDVPCPTNDPPIAVDDAASTTIGTSITVPVMDNDSDPDGDPITVTSASASNGTVVINGDGTITYTPDALFCGTDTVFYTICDPDPLCDDAIVVVDVPCPPDNDPPIAVHDSTGFNGDGVLVVVVLANDSDPNGDALTVTNAEAANGTVTIGGNGELYYAPEDGFCGIDTITYTVCDPQPLCDEAFVFVTVECPDTTDLAIPEGFSPNNDGYGDTWTIAGLERYPLAKVTIFNRWGNEVYSADPYGNDWDGRSANALTWDGVLPVGTYWYLLDLGMEGEEVRTGYIYLNR